MACISTLHRRLNSNSSSFTLDHLPRTQLAVILDTPLCQIGSIREGKVVACGYLDVVRRFVQTRHTALDILTDV